MRKVEIDVEGQSIAAQGGCLAVDLEAPLQGMAIFSSLSWYLMVR